MNWELFGNTLFWHFADILTTENLGTYDFYLKNLLDNSFNQVSKWTMLS